MNEHRNTCKLPFFAIFQSLHVYSQSIVMSVAHLFLQLMFNYDKTSTVEYTTMVVLCLRCTGTEY